MNLTCSYCLNVPRLLNTFPNLVWSNVWAGRIIAISDLRQAASFTLKETKTPLIPQKISLVVLRNTLSFFAVDSKPVKTWDFAVSKNFEIHADAVQCHER